MDNSGSIGTMFIYTNANIAIFMNTPPRMAGVAGAIFNSALQLGVALGVAIVASITQSVDQKRIDKGETPGYHGIAAGYWFVVAFVVVMFVVVLVFYKAESKIKPAGDVEGVAGAPGSDADADADSEKAGQEKGSIGRRVDSQ